MTFLRSQLNEYHQEMEQERATHRLVESNFLDLQREKSLLETEVRQMLQRHEEEYKSLNARLNEVNFNFLFLLKTNF